MRWLKRERWKVSLALTGLLLLLLVMIRVPASAAGVYERASGLATPGTVQVTPTVDPTMTALQKEQLTQQVRQLDNWWLYLLYNGSTAFIAAFAAIAVASIGLYQWRGNRNQERQKEIVAQDKDLKDRQAEREKRAEERFQNVVEGLGSERTEAKVGAAITLRTFLRPGYERFYSQAFDLAVVHLRLRKAEASAPEPPSSSAPVLIVPEGSLRQEQQPPPSNASIPLDSLSQALITVFKESFPLARKELEKANTRFDPQLLDATDVRLDNAYLVYADLVQAWLLRASLRKAALIWAQLEEADLRGARLEGAILGGAQLKGAKLWEAQFEGADLSEAQLEGANLARAQLKGAKLARAQLKGAKLWWAQLEGADLSEAQFEEADLRGARLEGANPEAADSLTDAKMNGVTGLTPEQREKCIKKGAIFDDIQQAPASDTSSSSSPSPAQSHDTAIPLAPSTQANTPPADADGSSPTSSKPVPES